MGPIDQFTAIFISAILDQNLGIIAACMPTFQPLFRSLAKTVSSIGHKLHSSGDSNYKILPDKNERRNHANKEAFNLGPLTSKPVAASNPQRDQDSQESNFALDGLKPSREYVDSAGNETVDSEYEAPHGPLYPGRLDAV